MMCEQTGPKQPERAVALAKQAGFDFAVIIMSCRSTKSEVTAHKK